jgi:protein SCO1
MYKIILFFAVISTFAACQSERDRLPFLGERIVTQRADGTIDSLPPTIRDFSFTNQNGETVTQKDVEGKIYLADFFFTSCPTICPKVKKQMRRVYAQFENTPDFAILSHSIDVQHDTVARLAWYGEKLNIKAPKWHLLTGDKTQIYAIAYDYLLSALEDKEAEGGFDHSGAVALIDKHRRIRGLYDALDEKRIDQLMLDIAKLLKEE